MARKPLKTHDLQASFFDETGEDRVTAGVGDGWQPSELTIPVAPFSAPGADQRVSVGYLDSLKMQIARDMAVLREGPTYHAPSREFYEERIKTYRLQWRAEHSALEGKR